MKQEYEPTKVLIIVKTYPHPSLKYKELVCTAGITEAGEWVRLYPVDYRYRPPRQKYKKYQWIEVGLLKHSNSNDNRKESREPDVDSIQILGEPLPSSKGWIERRKIIDNLPHHTCDELKGLYSSERVSLGIVRPSRVLDLIIKSANPEWKDQWEWMYRQGRLFDEQKPLRKLPYTFHYVFECEDSKKPHTAMIEDWELGMLFLSESERLGSDEAAAESVRKKFLNELCGAEKDTRFFMGTRFPYNTWLVLGVFWPPKLPPEPPTLFD